MNDLFFIICKSEKTEKRESIAAYSGIPENAEKNKAVVMQYKKLVANVLCRQIKIILTIHRSISMKELRGLKKIDSTEQSITKIKTCVKKERTELRVFCCDNICIYSLISPGLVMTKSSSALKRSASGLI